MRTGVAIALSIVSVSLGAGTVACFDLFHSTAGILTACEIDAQVCADGSVDAGTDGPIDFCAWTPVEARAHASHACAWLGACQTPMGGNAFGECSFSALLAYDCEANPGHPPRGEERALWDCLWQVQSCADVERCVFPGGVPACPPVAATTCASTGGAVANRDVRVECTDAGVTHGENCGLRGQTCATSGASGVCAGAAAGGGSGCTSECNGTHLHWCVDGGDIGVDCASNGAGRCGVFSASWAACVAAGDAGCTPDASAECTNGYAVSCPSGVVEAIDCTGLLQVIDGGCVPGPLNAPFDWTSACSVAAAMCAGDSCNGYTLTGCTRGAQFTTDCSAQGLGTCRMVRTDVGTQTHAACAPP